MQQQDTNKQKVFELSESVIALSTQLKEQNKRIEALEQGQEIDLSAAPEGVNMSNIIKVIADVKTELI